ncbi:hypothetical protein E3T61_18965 [Cryobacterium lactosi]|uniref:Uncharacterized protein n=1 Tax=Cryobacterium lactosi TaxID=1259202 RepID=A0A4V3IWE3_9MICO|nr:hypothetical protein [Cryobacterium lactosi]TFD84540.1 hypothetical protein E3T61_18965 [Cryobacterium lactosi]
MDTRWARLARGWVTAVVSVVVAAVSHVGGGGTLPGSLGAVLALTFAGLASVALAGKTLSRLRLSVSVMVSQFAFHSLFGLGAGSAPRSMTGPGSGHQHGAMMVEMTAPGGSAQAMNIDTSMWLAHAVAAVITIVLLRRGERAFWALLGLARTALGAVFPPFVHTACPTSAAPVRLRVALGDRPPLRDLVVLRAGRSLRGPPALV